VTDSPDCAAIERLITQLVREAPAIDPAIAGELVERLRHVGSPLAVSIARVVELVPEGLPPNREGGEVDDRPRRAQRVDPGIALPPLAMACATLAGGVRGELAASALEAARYEIETLLPVPEPRVRVIQPDVPVGALSRGRRPRP
jgi:hypothetical protein